ncbi:hypothetical protein HRbin41_01408 [bacterium HR41]|nr:hypothetical protein HRbin41_01408 [bacterium HR41]
MEVDENDDVHLVGVAIGEGVRSGDGVAAEGGDERVRHRSHSPPAPPRRLRVGRDTERPSDVRRPTVTGLYKPMVVAGREVEDRLAARRLHDLANVAHDQRPPGQAAQIDGLEMGEERIVALDQQDRLPGLDLVALVKRPHFELVPTVLPAAVGKAPSRAELEHRDRLVDATQHRAVLLKHLHRDARVHAALFEQPFGEVEVRVGVVAVADLLDRQTEDRRIEPLAARRRRAHGAGMLGGASETLGTRQLRQGRARHRQLVARWLARAENTLEQTSGRL